MRQIESAIERIVALQLRPGDIVTCIPRDGQRTGLTAGRARIDDVRPHVYEAGYVGLVYSYTSRNCTSQCDVDPFSCSHFGEAGGGSGRVKVAQTLDRYIKAVAKPIKHRCPLCTRMVGTYGGGNRLRTHYNNAGTQCRGRFGQ